MRRLPLALPVVLGLILMGWVIPVQASHPLASHEGMDLRFNSQNSTDAINSDLAFWGNHAFAGNYGGFRIFDISDPAAPVLVTDFPCDGPQNDVSVWDRDGDGQADILFLSVDTVMEGDRCGAPRHMPPQGGFHPGDWEGIRVFDISDPSAPFQLPGMSGAIYQDCGSHTHTLVPDPTNNRVLLYNSSYPLRNGPTCGPGFAEAAGRDPLHGVIQVTEVAWDPMDPLNNMLTMTETEHPIGYPGDPDNEFDPQAHGLPEEAPMGNPLNNLRACHDIGVLLGVDAKGNPAERGGLAAGACAEQAQLWRIDPMTLLPDTANPLWTFDNVADTDGPGGGDTVADFWHSATFSWDGKIVNFSDESFGSGCPPVSPNTDPAAGADGGPSDSGRTYFLKTKDGKLQSQFMIPRPDASAGSYCSTHQGNVVGTKDSGKYFLVQAWYTGGVGIVDFSNVKNPREVAFFDFTGPGAEGSDNWAHYWYETDAGRIVAKEPFPTYGQDGVHNPDTGRGFEAFEVTVNEAAKNKRVTLGHLNPQTQEFLLK